MIQRIFCRFVLLAFSRDTDDAIASLQRPIHFLTVGCDTFNASAIFETSILEDFKIMVARSYIPFGQVGILIICFSNTLYS
nr:hypothetical protein [Candidatus Sigynarchaeota archaeon]